MTSHNVVFDLVSDGQPFDEWRVRAVKKWCELTNSSNCRFVSPEEWAEYKQATPSNLDKATQPPTSEQSTVWLDNTTCAWPLTEAGWLVCENATRHPDAELTSFWHVLQAQWQLRENLQRTEQRASFISWLVSSISHDVKSPLNSILNFLALAEHPNSNWINQLPLVQKDAHRLNRLINQILDFSRLRANRLELVPAKTNMLDWAGAMIEAWRSQIQARNLSLKLYLDDSLPDALELDAERLSQIVHNLISNASKFTSDGFIELALSLNETGSDLVIDVTDTGEGIDASKIGQLFDLYVQSRSQDQFNEGGVGLGLNIVKQLTDLMGGQISVSSETGKGSVFRVTVPCTLPEEPSLFVHAGLLAQQSVLIIDEQERRISSLKRCLINFGASVTSARTGPEALFALRQAIQGPGWVLIAADLPGIGAELTLKQVARQFDWSEQEVMDRTLWLTDRQNQAHPLLHSLPLPASVHEVFQAMTFRNSTYTPAKSVVKPKVLVVDDTDLNLQMTQIQLNRLGVEVISVESGKKALDYLQTDSVDLVFMDIMMPDMDGFETTERIRELQRNQGLDPVVIVALTANALFNDPAKCNAAGMDDYLSKPYRQEELERLVRRYIPSLRGLANSIPDTPATQEEAGSEQEEPLVNWNQALAMVGGDEPILLTILEPFVNELPQTLAQLEQTVREEDWITLQRKAHSLKSMLRTFGATALGEAASDLEKAASKGASAHADTALKTFEDVGPATLKQLNAYLSAGARL